jgi:hypothetical protein
MAQSWVLRNASFRNARDKDDLVKQSKRATYTKLKIKLRCRYAEEPFHEKVPDVNGASEFSNKIQKEFPKALKTFQVFIKRGYFY